MRAPLDLNRPLWEIYVVEGLDSLLELPAGSFALLTKVHHAAVDAEGGSRIAMLLHDTTADAPAPPPPRAVVSAVARPAPCRCWLRGWLNSVTSPLQLRTPLARALADSANAACTFASDLLLRPEPAAGHALQLGGLGAPRVRHAPLHGRGVRGHPPPGAAAPASTMPCWRCAAARCAAICRPAASCPKPA